MQKTRFQCKKLGFNAKGISIGLIIHSLDGFDIFVK